MAMIDVILATMTIGMMPSRFTPVTTRSVMYTMPREMIIDESPSVRNFSGNVMIRRVVPRMRLHIVSTMTKTRRAEELV
jgi:hypothetical protein